MLICVNPRITAIDSKKKLKRYQSIDFYIAVSFLTKVRKSNASKRLVVRYGRK